LAFATQTWITGSLSKLFVSKNKALSPEHILTVLFTSNFIGIVFSRTLHYQFYTWYYHTLPFLLWQSSIPSVGKLAMWAVIEVVWNIYPSNSISSLILFLCHMIVLLSVWTKLRAQPTHAIKNE